MMHHLSTTARVMILLFVTMMPIHAQIQSWTRMGSTRSADGSITANDSGLFAVSGTTIERSKDGGATWQEVNTQIQLTAIHCITSINNNVLVGTDDGTIISTNQGESWRAGPDDLSHMVVSSFHKYAKTLYSTTNFGVFQSSNSGYNWKALNEGLSTNPDIVCASNKALFAFWYEGKAAKSSNMGSSWTSSDSGFPRSIITCAASSRSYVFAGTATNGLFLSTDDGLSWRTLSDNFTAKNIQSLYGEDGFIAVSATGSVMSVSTDMGNSWKTLSTGLDTSPIVSIMRSGMYLYALCLDKSVYRAEISTPNEVAESDALDAGSVFRIREQDHNLIIGIDQSVGDAMLNIYNARGVLINAQSVNAASQSQVIIPALPVGVYMVECRGNSSLVRSKFLILH